MPRTSGKENLIDSLCYKNLLDIIVEDFSEYIFNIPSALFNLLPIGSKDEDNDILMDFTINSAWVLRSRRSSHLDVPRSMQWNFDDGRVCVKCCE